MNSSRDLTRTPGGVTPISDLDLDNFNSISIGYRFNLGYDLGDFLIDAHFQSGFTRGEEFATFFGEDLGRASNWGLAIGYKLFRKKIGDEEE